MRASVTRARCKGTIIGCSKCKNLYCADGGYCCYCGRPANRQIGDKCNYIYAYVERGAIWNGKIKIKCARCKTVNVI